MNESLVPVGSWCLWASVIGDLGEMLSQLPTAVQPKLSKDASTCSEQSQCCLQNSCLAKLAGAKGPDQAEEVPFAVGDVWRVAALQLQ